MGVVDVERNLIPTRGPSWHWFKQRFNIHRSLSDLETSSTLLLAFVDIPACSCPHILDPGFNRNLYAYEDKCFFRKSESINPFPPGIPLMELIKCSEIVYWWMDFAQIIQKNYFILSFIANLIQVWTKPQFYKFLKLIFNFSPKQTQLYEIIMCWDTY